MVLSALEQLHIALTGIGKMLSDGPWVVPVYQRAYAWEEKHVRDLVRDLDVAIAHDEKEYFLGSIVITNTGSSAPEIVDGQQRLATTTILLAAIRDHFIEQNDGIRAKGIEEYLFDTDLRTQEISPKLRLNSVDHDFYLKAILQQQEGSARKLAPSKSSHERLMTAQRIAQEYVKTLTLHGSTDRLFDVVDYLEGRARVIAVKVPDDANAFTIFETLNDRGLALAITDLLKNYLFKQAGPKRIEETKQKWVAMVATLEAVEDETIVAEFIRHYWSSRFGLTRDKYLYDEFKKNVTGPAIAVTFAGELETESKLYAAMLSPGDEYWNQQTSTARDYMDILNRLGLVRLRPLVLSILRSFSAKKNVESALRLLVNWSVRFLITGGGAGTIETTYGEKAKEVRDGKIKTPDDLYKAMKFIVPTDTQFHDAFGIAPVSKSRIARYYLQVLEKRSQGQDQPEWVPNENPDEINLEHVMPQTPTGEWAKLDPELLRTYTRRLGNLCLMQSKENSGAANEKFSQKKNRYAKSEYKLTAMIANEHTWGADEIRKRQNYLADLAVKAWPSKTK